MLISAAPNGTHAPAREFICVPIDDKWEPHVGDELRHLDGGMVRTISALHPDSGFTYEVHGAKFNIYSASSYVRALKGFECFRPVVTVPPTITIKLPSVPPAVPQKPINPYMRRLPGVVTDAGGAVCGDVYTFLLAFDVTCPATQHALKKLACAGQRGSKSREQDLREALAAIQRAIEIETGKS